MPLRQAKKHITGMMSRDSGPGVEDVEVGFCEQKEERTPIKTLEDWPAEYGADCAVPSGERVILRSLRDLKIIAQSEDHCVILRLLGRCEGLRWENIAAWNKLFHPLHSVMAASIAEDLVRLLTGKHRQVQPRAYAANPLLIQALMDGISVPANRSVLQHWLDFVPMAVRQFQPALHAVVAPLNECICRQLQTSLDNALKASSHDVTFSDDTSSTSTDAEFIVRLNGLERLDQSGVEKSAESGGPLGYISAVFNSENAQQNVDEQLASCMSSRSDSASMKVVFPPSSGAVPQHLIIGYSMVLQSRPGHGNVVKQRLVYASSKRGWKVSSMPLVLLLQYNFSATGDDARERHEWGWIMHPVARPINIDKILNVRVTIKWVEKATNGLA
ncbi:hypothetical protein IW261DRAFT_1573260 [Armillaria novae-zelandiae]|uniref:Uncharacterized protein n=1 Tax=Armillaria novae-zelandiae TaxID=153914 RepID=A0AA39NNX2_9AGAR|nr:hypothetical protein IW261DRAFT_1573260 [Armillaria novae-zelandiae]